MLDAAVGFVRGLWRTYARPTREQGGPPYDPPTPPPGWEPPSAGLFDGPLMGHDHNDPRFLEVVDHGRFVSVSGRAYPPGFVATDDGGRDLPVVPGVARIDSINAVLRAWKESPGWLRDQLFDEWPALAYALEQLAREAQR